MISKEVLSKRSFSKKVPEDHNLQNKILGSKARLYAVAAPILALALAACAGENQGATDEQPASPRPSEEPKPMTTIEMKPTEPTSTQELMINLTQFNFGEDVPEGLKQEIRNGVNTGVAWLTKKSEVSFEGLSVYAYGDANQVIDEYFKRTIVPGNFDERRTGLQHVTAFAGEQKDFFVITTSPGWTSASPIVGGPIVEGRYHTIFHELFHVLQREVGGYNTLPLAWLNEGGAHYIAARALDENGIYSYDEIKRHHLSRTDFFQDPLQRLESQNSFSNVDNYSLSFLAMDFLTQEMSDHGISAIITYWREIGMGSNPQTAFLIAFGEPIQDFYARFSDYRQMGFQ